jgi:hypothetical protein
MGVVYENWYEDKETAVKELRRKAKDLVRHSYDEYFNAYYTVYLNGTVVTSGETHKRSLRHILMSYSGYIRQDYGGMTLRGVRLC